MIKKNKEYLPLNIYNFNAQGLSSKFAILSDFIAENDPDVITITETFLTDDVKKEEFCPPNYIPFRKDRVLSDYPEGTYKNPARGGVLILVKGSLNPEPANNSVDAEIIWIKINPLEKVYWLVGCCYRPEVAEEIMFEKICESINKNVDTTNVVLTGDFNLRNVDWEKLSSSRNIDNVFIDTILDNSLNQIIDTSTRGKNILDLVFVGDKSTILNANVEERFGKSDHKVVHVEVQCPVPKIALAKKKIYLYSKGDYDGLNDNLKNEDWKLMLNSKDIEVNWSRFKRRYNELIDKYVPSKLIRIGQRHKPPWTRYRSIKKAKASRRKAKIKAKISGTEADKILYEHSQEEVNNAIHTAKGHYEDKLVSELESNPKRFWNYTRHFSRSSSTIDYLKDCGEKVSNDTEKAELLNDFFASVLTKENDIDSSIPVTVENVKYTLKDICITPEHVRNKLLKLQANKASGPDLINVNVLRCCSDFDVPLCIIFNQSIQSSSVPQDWRDANVVPLHKKGSRYDRKNYRPVSLTSQVVKIMERLILDRMLELLEKNGTINCNQHGFQAKCSCVSQMLLCLNDWTSSFDNYIQTDVIYLDFSKAFDSVPHKRLLMKLKQVGIRGKILNWIESFLTKRRQRVTLQNGSSSWSNVISGVPQGSILGPVLFLIYINDLPNEISSKSKLFADDSKIYTEIKDINDCNKLQNDLNSLSVWSEVWQLKFNEDKCVVLKIRNNVDYKYTINGVYLNDVDVQKDLGILISNNLQPRYHIIESVKRANQRIGMLRRCFTNLTAKKVKTIYTTMIRPVIEYGAPVWSPYFIKDIKLIEKVQNRCLRLSTKSIELPSLKKRRLIMDLCEVYKYLHGLIKYGVDDLFTMSERRLGGHSLKLSRPYAINYLTI